MNTKTKEFYHLLRDNFLIRVKTINRKRFLQVRLSEICKLLNPALANQDNANKIRHLLLDIGFTKINDDMFQLYASIQYLDQRFEYVVTQEHKVGLKRLRQAELYKNYIDRVKPYHTEYYTNNADKVRQKNEVLSKRRLEKKQLANNINTDINKPSTSGL